MLYKIFCSKSQESLSELVTQKLSEGWELVGGLAIVPNAATSVGASKGLRNDVSVVGNEFVYNLIYCQSMLMNN